MSFQYETCTYKYIVCSNQLFSSFDYLAKTRIYRKRETKKWLLLLLFPTTKLENCEKLQLSSVIITTTLYNKVN